MAFLFSRSERFLRATSIAIFIIAMATVATAQSQTVAEPYAEHKFLDRTVRISARQKGLAAVLGDLAAATSIDILTDGVPDRVAADVNVQGTVRQALDQIGQTFDLRWAVSKSGIVLLSRRFSDPGEHPQIHMNEMRQMVRDIHAALTMVPREALESGFVGQANLIAHSLTPEQVEACTSGNLYGSGLNAQQLSWLNLAILNETLAPTVARCEEALPYMEGMTKSFLQLKPLAAPYKDVDPTDPLSNAARFPSFDYLYVIRDKSGRLNPLYLPKFAGN